MFVINYIYQFFCQANKTKIEANIVLKEVKGKIDDAKNQLSLLDTLEKLRKCRLQNCVNKRQNPLLEESLSIYSVTSSLCLNHCLTYVFFFFKQKN